MKKILFNLIIINLFLCNSFIAQNSAEGFTQLSIENGLSQSVILSIYQDSRGFIWIATQDGLNKYDGYEFKTFKTSEQNDYSLSSNYISAIDEDDEGNLWMATRFGGINKYNRSTGKINYIKFNNSLDNNSAYYFLKTIIVDGHGNIWTGGLGTGLVKYNPQINKFTFFTKSSTNNSLCSDSINVIFEDRDRNLWVGTNTGLNKFDPSDSTVITYKNKPGNSNSLSDNYIRCITQDKNGILWIGTDKGGLNKFDIEAEYFKSYSSNSNSSNTISGNSVNSIYIGKDGIMWIGVWGGGLNKFNPKDETFTAYRNNPLDPYSISSDDIDYVLQDNCGILWIGTYGGGVNLLNVNRNPFFSIRHNPRDSKSLSNDMVYSIFKDHGGTVWIGTWGGGLNIFNPVTKKITNHFKRSSSENSISDNRITAITEDNKKNLWIGTLDGGLNQFNKNTNSINSYTFESGKKYSICSNRINALYHDKHGFLWVGTLDKGICVLNLSTKKFIRYHNNPEDINSLSNDAVNCIYGDTEGNIWVATSNGLNKFNDSDKSFTRFFHTINDTTSLSSNWVSEIFQAKDGSIYIGTSGGGFNKLINNNGKYSFENFGFKNGLPNNVIYRILEDKDGFLWISTDDGLVKFNTNTKSFLKYYENDGLQSNEFKDGAFYDATNNVMYFGGIKGFTYFNPSLIKNINTKPKVVITKFNIFNKEVTVDENSPLQKVIGETKEIKLSYNDYVFSFEFAALNTPYPQKIKYEYKLEGMDKNWNHTDPNRRMASYSNLKGGRYKFKVRVSDNNGTWEDEEASINIIITPPYWDTWWFKICLILSFIAGIYFIYRIRSKSILEANKRLEDNVHERTKQLIESNHTKDRLFSIIAHDLKNPFTIFYGYSKIIKENVNGMSKDEIKEFAISINESASKIHTLLNNLLEWAQLQLGGMTIHKEKLNLMTVIDKVLHSLSDTAGNKNITLTNNTNPELLVFADEHMVGAVLRNLVSNSIKFTNFNGMIELSAEVRDGGCEISVKDNGIGISAENISSILSSNKIITSKGTSHETGTGLGLMLCKDFILKNNGDLHIESEIDKGTTVIFTLPIYNN